MNASEAKNQSLSNISSSEEYQEIMSKITNAVNNGLLEVDLDKRPSQEAIDQLERDGYKYKIYGAVYFWEIFNYDFDDLYSDYTDAFYTISWK